MGKECFIQCGSDEPGSSLSTSQGLDDRKTLIRTFQEPFKGAHGLSPPPTIVKIKNRRDRRVYSCDGPT